MHQAEAAGIPLEQLDAILPALGNPEGVHLIEHARRVGLGHEQVEKCALRRGLKLVSVRMVGELQPGGRQIFGPRVHFARSTANIIGLERRIVGNPGKDDPLHTQRLRLALQTGQVLGEAVILPYQCSGPEPRFRESAAELLRRQPVVAGYLDLCDAHLSDQPERARQVLAHLPAQAVNLQPRSFPGGSRSHVRRRYAQRRNGEGGDRKKRPPRHCSRVGSHFSAPPKPRLSQISIRGVW